MLTNVKVDGYTLTNKTKRLNAGAHFDQLVEKTPGAVIKALVVSNTPSPPRTRPRVTVSETALIKCVASWTSGRAR